MSNNLPNLNPIDEVLSAVQHAEIAAALQTGVDQAIESGDYAAAAQLREAAEAEAWLATDSSMLHGSDAIDLTSAADAQENAAYYEELQAEAVQDGDYEAARDLAWEAADATKDADFNAGGEDHSAQPLAEMHQMNEALDDQSTAEWHVAQAESWAEHGAYDTADAHLQLAAEAYDAADAHAASGEHGAAGAVYEPSSETTEVDSWQVADSAYDASSVSSSSYDTSSSYTATSYDSTSSYDTSSSYEAPSYDSSSTDTV